MREGRTVRPFLLESNVNLSIYAPNVRVIRPN